MFLKGAGKGKCEVLILDPNRQEKHIPLRATGQDTYRCDYTPQTVGLHSVNIFYDGQPITGSPIGVNVRSGKLNRLVVFHATGDNVFARFQLMMLTKYALGVADYSRKAFVSATKRGFAFIRMMLEKVELSM